MSVAGGGHEVEVHRNFVCDGCEATPIMGNRYRSLTKADYDLCESCFGKAGEDRSGFIRVSSNAHAQVASPFYGPSGSFGDGPFHNKGPVRWLWRAPPGGHQVLEPRPSHLRPSRPLPRGAPGIGREVGRLSQEIAPQWHRPPSSEAPKREAREGLEVEVHRNFVCDGCEATPIMGKRYRSLTKADYDLCESCFGKTDEDKSGFQRVKSNVHAQMASSCYGLPGSLTDGLVHSNVVCDGRGEFPLVGTRLPAVEELKRQASEAPKEEVHRNVVCDGCEATPIMGKRYRSSSKADYDLCESCFDRTDQDKSGFIRVTSNAHDQAVSEFGGQSGPLRDGLVHSNAQCDGSGGCGELPLVGTRFRSLDRPDNDLCGVTSNARARVASPSYCPSGSIRDALAHNKGPVRWLWRAPPGGHRVLQPRPSQVRPSRPLPVEAPGIGREVDRLSQEIAPQWHRPPSSEEPRREAREGLEVEVHSHFVCGGCEATPIRGKRCWLSTKADYDLCESCFDKTDEDKIGFQRVKSNVHECDLCESYSGKTDEDREGLGVEVLSNSVCDGSGEFPPVRAAAEPDREGWLGDGRRQPGQSETPLLAEQAVRFLDELCESCFGKMDEDREGLEAEVPREPPLPAEQEPSWTLPFGENRCHGKMTGECSGAARPAAPGLRAGREPRGGGSPARWAAGEEPPVGTPRFGLAASGPCEEPPVGTPRFGSGRPPPRAAACAPQDGPDRCRPAAATAGRAAARPAADPELCVDEDGDEAHEFLVMDGPAGVRVDTDVAPASRKR